MTKLMIVIAALGFGALMLWKTFFGKKTGNLVKRAERPAMQAADMSNCVVCGTYVAAGSKRCERAGCPLQN
ncbi:MAG: hypothetical protein EXQ91_09585 [Alphaproteobacteria bacterium]|nr:hypothetical protein [Alphaproteobacteria bacterium]